MRYRATISIRYTAGGGGDYPDAARESLAAAVAAQVGGWQPGALTSLRVTVRPGRVVVVDATIQGMAPLELSSPLDALSRVDAGVLRALALTGQFEEFDVVSRELSARPA